MKLPDHVYDIIKYLVLIAIPALCTAYLGIDAAVDLPAEDAVVKIGAVVATLLGTLTGISSVSYRNSDARFDGSIDPYYANAVTSPAALSVKDIDRAQEKREVVLKVESMQDANPTLADE
jgi:hypothetical protein